MKRSRINLIAGFSCLLIATIEAKPVVKKKLLLVHKNRSADSLDSVRHSTNCKRIAAVLERHYGLPSRVLQAIGMVESSLCPWTVCVGVNGRRFKSRQAAESYLNGWIRTHGTKRSDCYIGCMQLSYRCHRRHFRQDNLLDPFQNMDYAARLIKKFYRRYGNWEQAIQSYHSIGTFASERYAHRVISMWRKITPSDQLYVLSAALRTAA